VPLDASSRRSEDTAERIEERALARSVRPEHGDELTPAKLDADIAHDLARAATDAETFAAEQ